MHVKHCETIASASLPRVSQLRCFICCCTAERALLFGIERAGSPVSACVAPIREPRVRGLRVNHAYPVRGTRVAGALREEQQEGT